MEDDTTNGLENQLQSFSISSADERIANDLANTHITSRNMFGTPSASLHVTAPPPAPPTTTQQKKEGDGWGEDDGEGWGKGPPSYTSLIQGTYFGFNSIMEPSPEVAQELPTPQQQTQAFNRSKNKKTTFSSALQDLENK
jgi:hypothetical protein